MKLFSLIGIFCIASVIVSFVNPKTFFLQKNIVATLKQVPKDSSNYKVTFIELGSVKCIPCKEMQPVMKSIEKKYGSQVKVIFHDVWTAAGKEAAK